MDESGRIPLSSREYTALRAIFGSFNALELYHKELERRCKTWKGGWRDLRLLCVLSRKIMEKVLQTIPHNKLVAIRKELQNTICEVKVKGVTGSSGDACIYVSEPALVRLTEDATEMKCFGCEKTQKEAKKSCQLYKDIQATFHYEFENCGDCPFSNM